MSGYRQSSFDPNAEGELFPPPPSWVQRIGIGFLFAGALAIFAFLGGQWGVIPKWIDSPIPSTMLVVLAGPLMGAGARREPLSREAKRRNLIIIAAAFAVCALAAGAIIYFKGA